MAQCPICGALVPAQENQVCENCRRSSYTASVDPQGRQVITETQQPAERLRRTGVPVTRMLIAANVAVFLLMVVSGVSAVNPTGEQIAHWGADFGPWVLTGQYWRMLTAVFVHIGIFHLFVNMWSLWQLGNLAERLFGPRSYLAIYLLAGIAGNILSIARNPIVLAAGASGAIFGIAGALIAALKFAPLNAPPDEIKAVRNNLIYVVAINLAFGAYKTHIDNMAHIGGLICGFLVALLLSLNMKSRDGYQRAKRLIFPLTAAILLSAFVGVRMWRLPWLEKHLPELQETNQQHP